MFDLWGCLTLDALERIIEGASAGDFIGTIDLTRSFRMGGASKIRLKMIHPCHIVADCPGTVHEEACHMALNSSPHLFKSPAALEDPSRQARSTPTSARARYLATVASHSYDLCDLSRWTKAPELSGIGASVFAQLENESAPGSDVDTAQLAAAFDPVLAVANPRMLPHEEFHVREELNVDLTFVDLDPESTVARKFVARASPDMRQSLLKTEAAEETHQCIVRYIAAGLATQNIIAQQSRSIDLFASINGHSILFEVKSANTTNALAQFSAGAVQLHAYALAYEDLFGRSAVKALVLQHFADNSFERYCLERLSSSLRVRLLFCDAEKPWPLGLKGLELLLGAHA